METPVSASETVFKVFLFTDIVGSTDYKRLLGDTLGADAIAKHDALFRDCLARFAGEEAGHSGDGFFATFDAPSVALRCALTFELELAKFNFPQPVMVRLGIHVGESIRLPHGGTGGAQDKLVGLAIDLASRVMSLAAPRQILMTRAAFDSARQQMKTGPDGEPLRWLAHGQYVFKGVEEPVEIFEAGIEGFSLLAPPGESEKATRSLLPGEEDTLGWRPALGIGVPGREAWVLRQKLGEGGFGEVWLAWNDRTQETRTFKFCFRPDRLRTLKRELTLFRLMKEALGERPDIARLYDVKLDAPPYFLEMEYTAGGDLATWSERKGGINAVAPEVRLVLVAQIGDALTAAHSVGVIHKDVKPRNVLIDERMNGALQARLTDFGIGQLLAPAAEHVPGKKLEGFSTESTTILSDLASRTGTRIYMAPELLVGRVPSIQTDIYALGVLLYQVVVGDLNRPLGQGWERDIADELIRDDIRKCVDGDPARRFASAIELSDRLRELPARRAERERELRAREGERRAAAQRRLARSAALAGVVLLVATGVLALRERQRAETEAGLRREADVQRDRAEHETYLSQLRLAQEQAKSRNFRAANGTLMAVAPARRGWEWGYLFGESNKDLLAFPRQRIFAFAATGGAIATAGDSGMPAVWDAETGQPRAQCEGGETRTLSLAFSPDGKTLAGGLIDGSVLVWDAASGKLLQKLSGHAGYVNSVQFSPDGNLLLSASQDKKSRIWEWKTGAERGSISEPAEFQAAEFSPNGTKILGRLRAREKPSDFGDFSLGIWRISDLGLVARISGDRGAFDSSGGRIACFENFEIRIVNGETGETIRTLSGHSGEGLGLKFFPDGTRLASCAADRTVRIWDPDSGAELQILRHSGEVAGIDISRDGRWMLSRSAEGLIRVWDTRTGAEMNSFNAHQAAARFAAFSPEGLTLATASDEPEVKVWPALKSLGETVLEADAAPIHGFAVSPSGDRIAVLRRGRTLSVLDAASGAPVFSVAAFPMSEGSAIHCVEYSPDGTRIAAILDDLLPTVLDAETGSVVASFAGHTGRVTTIEFGALGRVIATGGLEGVIRLWDPADGKETRALGDGESPVTDAAFSPDGALLAAGAESGQITVWNPDTGGLSYVIAGEGKRVSDLEFTPDSKLLAAGFADGAIQIREARSGAISQSLPVSGAGLRRIKFGGGGRRALTINSQGQTALWDAGSWDQVIAVGKPQDDVMFAGFDSAERALFTASDGGYLRRWDVMNRGGIAANLGVAEIRALLRTEQTSRQPMTETDGSVGAAVPLTIITTRRNLSSSLRDIARAVGSAPVSGGEAGLTLSDGPALDALTRLAFREGDRLISIAGAEPKRGSAAALAQLGDASAAGSQAELSAAVERGGRRMDVRFAFVDAPPEERVINAPRAEAIAVFSALLRAAKEFPWTIRDVAKRNALWIGEAAPGPDALDGVWVSAPPGEASRTRLLRLGLAEGDRVRSINGRIIDSMEALRAGLEGLAADPPDGTAPAPAALEIERGLHRSLRLTIRMQ